MILILNYFNSLRYCSCSYDIDCKKIVVSIQSLGFVSAAVQEYCTAEEAFEVNCLNNEVTVITSAVYGRMKMGRCLEDERGDHFQRNMGDPKFIGCSEDVLQLISNKCSGRTRCEVRLTFDNDFRKIKPCHAALKLYLEASYQCISG